ncbi:MAG: hypothetical protein QOH27_3531, partial [Mycobacterium sp.]|nr:hypothetical protein [Mycobacterium sp.]
HWTCLQPRRFHSRCRDHPRLRWTLAPEARSLRRVVVPHQPTGSTDVPSRSNSLPFDDNLRGDTRAERRQTPGPDPCRPGRSGVAVWTTRQAAGQGRVRVDRPRATYVGPNAEEGGSDGVARRWAGRASDATIAACALARRSGRRQPAGSPTAEDRDGAVAGHAGSCPLVAFGGRLGPAGRRSNRSRWRRRRKLIAIRIRRSSVHSRRTDLVTATSSVQIHYAVRSRRVPTRMVPLVDR